MRITTVSSRERLHVAVERQTDGRRVRLILYLGYGPVERWIGQAAALLSVEELAEVRAAFGLDADVDERRGP